MAKVKDTKRIRRTCVSCGKCMTVFLFSNRRYTGGHYFGKIPVFRKRELQKAMEKGTRRVAIGKLRMNVLKKDPRPYKFFEYWECDPCYWQSDEGASQSYTKKELRRMCAHDRLSQRLRKDLDVHLRSKTS